MTRSAQREQAFQILFRLEFNEASEMEEQENLFFDLSENQLSDTDKETIKAKVDNVIANLSTIDNNLNEKVTGWDISRIGKVELAILRLAVYEILFDDDIPTGVAINEAVELAKKFGQDSSGSFINGVLAKFAKE